jgi:hypothetical protein
MPTAERPSGWDRAALWITVAYLLAFLAGGLAFVLMLQRRQIGSWRGVVAGGVGIATWLALGAGGAHLLRRAGWLGPQTAFRVRTWLMRLALVATAGAAGGIAAAAVRADDSPWTRAAEQGAVAAVSLALAGWMMNRGARSTPREPPAT